MATKISPDATRWLDPMVARRIVDEGFGPGAWHGPDLKAAITDLTPETAFWRPQVGRHNIAEIVLHHAYCIRSVRGQLTGETPEPFPIAGEDWFEASTEKALPWAKIVATLEAEQRQLVAAISALEAEEGAPAAERFGLVLGITCHAIYHAGQIQLIKRLRG